MNKRVEATASEWVVAMDAAHAAEERGEWETAERAYHEALDASADTPELRSQTLCNVANWLEVRGFPEEAERAYSTAVAVANEGSRAFPVALALSAQAYFLLGRCRTVEARMAAEHIEALCRVDRGMPRMESTILLIRTACSLEEGNVDEAERYLAAVRQVLGREEPDGSLAAGNHGREALYWGCKARMHCKRKEREPALYCFARVVAHRRSIVAAPQLRGGAKLLALAKSLDDYASLLAAAERDQEAADAREESVSISKRLGLAPRS